MTPIGMGASKSQGIKPITPAEAADLQADRAHPAMVQVVNDLIIREYDHGTSRVLARDIRDEFFRREKGVSDNDFIRERYMNFAPTFRKAGWVVKVDKPGFNETYEAVYVFSTK